MIFRNLPMKKKTSLKLLIDECFKRVWKMLVKEILKNGCNKMCVNLLSTVWLMHALPVLLQNKEVNKEWWGWDWGGGCLITCVRWESNTVTLQPWRGMSSGEVYTNKQTNLSKTNPLNRPSTWFIKQFVVCYKNTKENILNYQWFSIRHILQPLY